MRFVRYEADGCAGLGVLNAQGDGIAPLAAFAGCSDICDMNQLVQSWHKVPQAQLAAFARGESCPAGVLELQSVRLLAPIERPVHDILCVGVNYQAHYEECERAVQMQKPEAAVYFSKRTCGILGPEAVIESHKALDAALDYEVELAVVIGKGGRDIPAEEVEKHIFGYSVFNDVSARTLQRSHAQWFRGKSLDGFAVMGPALVTRDELPFPLELEVESRVNGEVRQHSNTRAFIRDIPTLISELSQGLTLEAGDIIATGTPAGVGMGFDPPRYMKPGDVVECEIEALGVLRSTVGQ